MEWAYSEEVILLTWANKTDEKDSAAGTLCFRPKVCLLPWEPGDTFLCVQSTLYVVKMNYCSFSEDRNSPVPRDISCSDNALFIALKFSKCPVEVMYKEVQRCQKINKTTEKEIAGGGKWMWVAHEALWGVW